MAGRFTVVSCDYEERGVFVGPCAFLRAFMLARELARSGVRVGIRDDATNQWPAVLQDGWLPERKTVDCKQQ